MSEEKLPDAMVARVSIAVGELTKIEEAGLKELAKCYLYGGRREWKPMQQLSPRAKLLEFSLLNSLITFLEKLPKKDKTQAMITAQAKVTKARNAYEKIMPKGNDI